MKILENMTFDEERALYGSRGLAVKNCRFDGPADGESAFKECSDIAAENCFFNLRYPFWHDKGLKITGSEMTDLCRAALWYSENIEITDTKMHGIKALRECRDITMKNCDIVSPEFGWSTSNILFSTLKTPSLKIVFLKPRTRFGTVKILRSKTVLSRENTLRSTQTDLLSKTAKLLVRSRSVTAKTLR